MRMGLSQVILSDNGTEFDDNLSKILGMKVILLRCIKGVIWQELWEIISRLETWSLERILEEQRWQVDGQVSWPSCCRRDISLGSMAQCRKYKEWFYEIYANITKGDFMCGVVVTGLFTLEHVLFFYCSLCCTFTIKVMACIVEITSNFFV